MAEIVQSPAFILLLSITLLKLIYVLAVQLRVSILKPIKATFSEPVSIVICARNEAENLLELIPILFEQDYQHFEVIVVNDRSIDDSKDILRAFENKYPNLKVTDVIENDKFNFNKKFALTLGIKAANYKHVLLTDADCRPTSKNWISKMVAPFAEDKMLVIGYGGYEKTSGFVNKIIRVETTLIAQQYFGLGKLGMPYMGVGRNLAYNTDLFFKNKGFRNHQNLNSGDDDLFINETASSKNTAFVFEDTSYTLSKPKTSWKDYLEQKRRHLTTSVKYRPAVKFVLGLISLINYSFYGIIISYLILNLLPLWVLGSITVILLSQMAVSYAFLKKNKSLDLLPLLFICDIFILIFYPVALLYNYLHSGSLWKNY